MSLSSQLLGIIVYFVTQDVCFNFLELSVTHTLTHTHTELDIVERMSVNGELNVHVLR